MPEYAAQQYWDEVAGHIGGRSDGGGVVAGDDTEFYRLKRSMFLRRFLGPALREASTVLEVGCGPGGNVRWLTEQGKKVVGADLSETMLRHAGRTVDAEFVHIDGRTLPFEDRRFEAVFVATVLQHNPPEDARSLLLEMARVAEREVHLFEDTAVLPVHDRASHWLRRPSWYAATLRDAGFTPVATERLRLSAQEVSAALVRAAASGGRHEGARATRRHVRAEAAVLPVARVVDAVVPPAVGLTRMSFRRVR